MPIAEVVDRYTILSLRNEKGQDTSDEVEVYKEALDEAKIDPQLVIALRDINRAMWEIEERADYSDSAERLAAFFITLRELGKIRIKAKNRIAESYGEPLEVKSYHLQ